MVVRSKQKKSREKRARRTREVIDRYTKERFSTPPLLTAELATCPKSGNPYVVGRLKRRIVYTSKVVRSDNHAVVLKQNWIRRAARRLAKKGV